MKIQKNVIAMIVIMGITVIPTLYAWFNISASWDPYGNTGALKLAVASDDKGYESDLIAVKINMGEQILSSLHKNSQFNWVFTNSKDAQKGVKSGEYYAAIVIPEDFSQKMMSVFSSEAEHPDLTYYENEKENENKTKNFRTVLVSVWMFACRRIETGGQSHHPHCGRHHLKRRRELMI